MQKIQHSQQTHEIHDNPRCPLCGQPADVYLSKQPPNPFEGHCDVCGDVRITLSAAEKAGSLNKKHLISAWTRQCNAIGPAEILNEDSIDAILKDVPAFSVLDKLDRTLSVISRMTRVPGKTSTFQGNRDYPLIYAQEPDEAYFYLRELANLGYLVHKPPDLPVVSAQGFRHLSEIQRASRESAFVFVAMWFDPSMNEIYDNAIQPAIRQAGYKAVRIDREHHANRIDDEIIGRIRGSRFMVADFTGQRAGVYFEAGLMLGLGRTVVWMCKGVELRSNLLHFDTRQYNFIDYETVEEAKKRLYERIIALEGEGS
jgi:hypothetical protein